MKTRSKALALVAAGIFAAVVIVLVIPSPVDPAAWSPPAAPPFEGVLAVGEDALTGCEILAAGEGVEGPEDVAIGADGRIWAGTADGRIVRFAPGGGEVETVAETGGRPLGLAWEGDGEGGDGRLLVVDAVGGLLAVAAGGTVETPSVETPSVETLSKDAGGEPFGLADDLDVAPDGRVYFSDASRRWGLGQILFDLLEARPWGSLLRYDPATRRTEKLLDDLYFANGVAVAADGSFVLVNETYRYRVTRLWLTGERAGEREILIDNLPGFPDGISRGPRGTFWIALFTVRNPVMDRLHPHPFLKARLAALPAGLWPKPVAYGLVLEVDASGRVLQSLHDSTGGHVAQVTSVEEVGGFLYLGNLDRRGVARCLLGE